MLQIINLKRFQFLNGRWVKSHKIVNFPLEKFDPANYIATRPCPGGQCLCESNQSNHSCHSVPKERIRSSSCDLAKTKSGECLI